MMIEFITNESKQADSGDHLKGHAGIFQVVIHMPYKVTKKHRAALMALAFWPIFESMFNVADILTITFTLFAVIDVIGAVPIIISLKNRSVELHPGISTLFAGGLMLLFLFVGEKILNLMGVDVQSFAVAGSVVIFILGIELVLGINLFRTDPDLGKSGSIVPLGFPILAGSGTLTTVMSLHSVYSIPNIMVGIAANLVVIYGVLRSVDFLEKKIGKSTLGAMKKFFGVILLAIAVKIFVAAIYQFKPPH
jgi:multiple antibiotic resistance protein